MIPSRFRSTTSAWAGCGTASVTIRSSAPGSYGFSRKTLPFTISHANTSSFRSSERCTNRTLATPGDDNPSRRPIADALEPHRALVGRDRPFEAPEATRAPALVIGDHAGERRSVGRDRAFLEEAETAIDLMRPADFREELRRRVRMACAAGPFDLLAARLNPGLNRRQIGYPR